MGDNIRRLVVEFMPFLVDRSKKCWLAHLMQHHGCSIKSGRPERRATLRRAVHRKHSRIKERWMPRSLPCSISSGSFVYESTKSIFEGVVKDPPEVPYGINIRIALQDLLHHRSVVKIEESAGEDTPVIKHGLTTFAQVASHCAIQRVLLRPPSTRVTALSSTVTTQRSSSIDKLLDRRFASDAKGGVPTRQ